MARPGQLPFPAFPFNSVKHGCSVEGVPGSCEWLGMRKEDMTKFSPDEIEAAMEYVAYTMVHAAPSYGLWLDLLEQALERACKEDPLVRARALLTRVKGA